MSFLTKNYRYFLALMLLTLTNCSALSKGKAVYPKSQDEIENIHVGKLTDGQGLTMFIGDNKKTAETDINVNSYLWQAALDTIYFMPLISADPFGGTIITDWYSTSSSTKERYKLNIIIVGPALRSDAIKVATFKQVKNATGVWQDTQIDRQLSRDIEDKIIATARAIKVHSSN